jgi:hypothetical protein
MDDELTALLERLGELTDDELADLRSRLEAEADRLDGEPRTDENVAEIVQVADAYDTVVAEGETRAAAAAERETTAATALDRIRTRNAPADSDADADQPEGTDADADQPADADAQADQPEAVAAAAATRRPAARPGPAAMRAARGQGTPAAQRADRSPTGTPARRASLVAAAGAGNAGQPFGDIYDLAGAIDRRLRGMGRGASGEHVLVASVEHAWPEDRILNADAPGENTRRIDAVTAREATGVHPDTGAPALIAAGGLCAPLPNLYDVPVLGDVNRPIRDGLAGFRADRGGVQWRVPPTMAALTDSAGIWTLQNDIDAATAGGADPTKAIIDVVCPATDSATVEAITSRLRFQNIASRFDPESVAANIRLASVVHARLAENTLLAKINAESLHLTYPKTLGALRDVLAMLEHTVAYFRSRYRIDGIRLRAICPYWLVNMVAVDIIRAMHNAGTVEQLDLDVEARLTGWFRRRNIEPTWHNDGLAAVASASGAAGTPAIDQQFYSAVVGNTSVPQFPDVVSINLFPEGSMLFLDGGQLDLGVIRDSTLNSKNQYEQFMETFEGLAYRGEAEAWQVAARLEGTGGSAGTVDTSALDD